MIKKLLGISAGGREPTFPLGGRDWPLRTGRTHICVTGATGSGKSITLRLIMQAVLPLIGKHPGFSMRALLYDAKRDSHQTLFGMLGLDPQRAQDRIRTLDPFDARGWAWAIHEDVRSFPSALQVATILIPDQADANPFFTAAAKDIVCGVMRVFIKRGKPWDLRDVILACMEPDHLRPLLVRCPATAHLIKRYFGNERLLNDVIATIGTKVIYFEPIAAAWWHAAKAGRALSLQDWVRGNYILLLGNDEANRSALDTINRVVFKRISELLLAEEPNTQSRLTWVFLDELAKAGRLDGLDDLLTKGRSYGIACALGFQDIDSLRDPNVYGENVANALVGQCALKAILKLYSRPTADWAEGLVGDVERLEDMESYTQSGMGDSTTVSKQYRKTEAIMASEWLTLPPANDERHVGVCVSPDGVQRYALKHRTLLAAKEERVRDFEPRPDSDYELEPWTPAELRDLGLTTERAPEHAPKNAPDSTGFFARLRRMGGGR